MRARPGDDSVVSRLEDNTLELYAVGTWFQASFRRRLPINQEVNVDRLVVESLGNLDLDAHWQSAQCDRACIQMQLSSILCRNDDRDAEKIAEHRETRAPRSACAELLSAR